MDNVSKARRRAASYVAWCRLMDKRPSRLSNSTEERRLAAWISRYKQYINGSTSKCYEYEEVTEYLKDKLGSHTLMDRRARSMEFAKKYVEFCMKNGRRPTLRDDGTMLSDELAAWYYNYRKSLRPNSRMAEYPEVTKYVTDRLGPEAFSTSDIEVTVCEAGCGR